MTEEDQFSFRTTAMEVSFEPGGPFVQRGEWVCLRCKAKIGAVLANSDGEFDVTIFGDCKDMTCKVNAARYARQMAIKDGFLAA
jgi:hypothetical protein